MPLDRPIREPIIGPDGKLSRRWADYFDNLDTGQTVTTTFETETKFYGMDSPLTGDTRRLKTRMTTAETDIATLQEDVRALKFLDT